MMKIENSFNFSSFDLVFSFAGEDRYIVSEIYNKLKGKYNIFYDEEYTSQLLGSDLYNGLRNIYKNNGLYVVCFISKYYAKKIWTSLEFTAIKERLMSTFFTSDFLIPILIDDYDLNLVNDIPSYIAFYKHESIEKTVQILDDKISSSTIEYNFISNVNKVISFLCEQIYKKLNILDDNKIKLIRPNELQISNMEKSFSLVFLSDTEAQSSCILVRKISENLNINEIFPTFIITWEKDRKIDFSIHEFTFDIHSDNQKLSLNKVIQYFSDYIKLFL